MKSWTPLVKAMLVNGQGGVVSLGVGDMTDVDMSSAGHVPLMARLWSGIKLWDTGCLVHLACHLSS